MKNRFFLFLFLSFVVFFTILLVAESQGYYKNRNEKAKIMTDEEILRFEEDIASGRDIDVSDYILYEDKDYSNKISTNVYKVSLKLESVVDGIIRFIFSGTSKMVSD